MGVSSAALGVGSREDGVHKNECAQNLGTEAVALGVAVGHRVGAAALGLVEVLVECLDHSSSADGSQALHHHVEHCSRQRQFPGQEQPKRHCWVDVAP